MKKTIWLGLVLAAVSFAQPIGLGVKGGIPFGDLFDSNTASVDADTENYIVGPMIEVRLPGGLAIEADALYTKTKFTATAASADTNSWEFPVLLKKKFGGANAVAASARPYIGAGVSFRKLTGLTNVGSFITGNSDGAIDRNNTGFVIGGGVEIRALFIRIAPEVRFTYWGTETFSEGLSNVFKTNKAQGQFLIGLYF